MASEGKCEARTRGAVFDALFIKRAASLVLVEKEFCFIIKTRKIKTVQCTRKNINFRVR